jgi:hypothetical protein
LDGEDFILQVDGVFTGIPSGRTAAARVDLQIIARQHEWMVD